MARVGIIGGGAFGTALACVMRRSGHDTAIWAREPEVVAAINERGTNERFLSGVRLPPGIVATGDLAAAADGADFLLLAPPAQHMRAVAARLRPFLAPGIPVVSCAKGIERGSCALMPEVLAEVLPRAKIAVLSGPSFAREIARDLPCGVTLACADKAAGQMLAEAIGTPRFRTDLSEDAAGAAIGGAMKNVVAVAAGVVQGKGLGESARATVITRGLAETVRLGLAKGARAETFMGLSGVGDLVLSCGSLQSRNTALGVALGEGRKPGGALAEGALSVEAVAALAKRLGLELPIVDALDELLNRGADLDAAVARLVAHAC